MKKVLLNMVAPAPMLEQMRKALPEGVELEMVTDMTEKEFERRAAEAEVVLNTPMGKLDAGRLAQAPKVRFIQQFGVGYDNIDLEAAKAAGIMVANTPGVNTIGVAEHTVMLMLTLLKRFVAAEHSAREGHWATVQFSQAGIAELSGATVGLVGMGAIGRATAERLAGFGCKLLYTARRQLEAGLEGRLKVSYASLPQLLAESNIVSLHVSLNMETRNLIGEKELALMRQGSYLINTSRGGLVDEAALRRALESGQLAGVGLDVLENEAPGGNGFADLPQVFVTPHIGGISQVSVGRAMQTGLANLGRYLTGQTPLYLVGE